MNAGNNGEPSNADLMRVIQSMSLDIGNEMKNLAEEVKQLRFDTDAKFAENRAEMNRVNQALAKIDRRLRKLEERKETQ